MMAINTNAQDAVIELKTNSVTISQLINEIEKQTDYLVVYSNREVDTNRRVNFQKRSGNVSSYLNEAFSNTEIGYDFENNYIVLSKKVYQNATTIAQLIQATQQQDKKITGKITDENGDPVIGATIVEKDNPSRGTITDVNGNYTLTGTPENATLQFTYVGMKTQEVAIDGRTTINIVLEADTELLDELVVVGYGVQKKVNLTGSIVAINEKDIEKLNVTQPSQLLAGLASGVTVTQSSGQPGSDAATLRIRGLGTFSSAGTSPLVLIDGISSDMNHINANDIESISILKDAASAAIYGTRAANGVILIETKKGKEGITKINYQGSFGFQRPSEIPKIVDSWVYAEMINEALRNAGSNQQYTEAEIAKFKSGEDQDNYPNKRHYDDLVKSGDGFQTEHYLNFTSGNDKNSYLFSLGYLNQNGFVDETNHTHYNVLFNASSKVSNNFRLNVKFQGRAGSTSEPTTIRSGDGVDGLLNYALKIPNTIAGKKSDGYYGQQTGFTIEGWMDSESFIKNTSNRMNVSAGFEWDILKSLKLTGLAGYNYDNTKYKRFWPVLVVDQTYTESPSELTETRTENSLLTLQSFLNYNKAIDKHEFNVLGGYSQENNTNSWLRAFRDNFPSNTLYEISAGAPSNQLNGGSGYEWALQSFFGRFNYVFDGKYLFEANTRYDGSSRFPASKRWGLFPSVSAGWIISQEKFFHFEPINHLKIRTSWGKLGNQNIGNYPYQQILTLGVNAPFGVSEKMFSGAAATVVPSTDITWESTRVVGAGLDIGLINNKVNASIDIYDKLTSDILYNVTASTVLGMTPSVQNAGVVSNKGIDLNLQHRHQIGDFSYNISANFSYVKNEVKQLATVIQDINSGLFVGYPLQSIYGYVADGLFVDQQDVDNYPTQPRVAAPGDIKLKDISGPDGVPDGKVNADYDRKIIGNQFPKYTYGLTFSPRYKNFDLFINMYGVAGVNKILGGFADNAFYQGSNPQEWMMDRWTKENPNPNAPYPRFLVVGGGEQQFYRSTFVMQDASFLRISNLQLGYTVPEKLVKKIWMSNLYVYINVKNPFTFDRFREGWDPEMGTGYPPARYFSAGVNINF
ncbi:SusC/RagA family TonB-linked outer membrane protein [Proteiniphilum saccharofermentans]|nr:TonB-dependent receptor [Proteiniphilum saccharofermentans]